MPPTPRPPRLRRVRRSGTIRLQQLQAAHAGPGSPLLSDLYANTKPIAQAQGTQRTVERSTFDPTALGAFNRWSDAAWKRDSLALR